MKIDTVFNKIANSILIIIAVALILYFLIEIWYPYAAGDVQMKIDYYQKHKL